MTYWKGLQVRMLGGFELEFEGSGFHLPMKQSSKPVQMFQMLLEAGEAGVSRRSFIDALFGQEPDLDVDNTLNVLVSRLRKLLRSSALPEENYITVRFDRYFFESSFPVWVDTAEVSRLRQAADLAADADRVSILYRLCDLYEGRFLPELDGEDWVEVSRAHYQRIYRVSMEEICRELERRQAYTELLRLTGFAARIFPFDEWQSWQQESLLALGRVREARELYREVEKLYMSELDAPPPERLRSRFPSERESWREAERPETVARAVFCSGDSGPVYLPLPSFLAACRLLRAGGQRPVCLLCTLWVKDVKVHAAMELAETALNQTLGAEDAFTQYSRSQFLAVLPGADRERAGALAERLRLLAEADGACLRCEILESPN